ncbi:2-polyprenyl-3-methyl-5-hydroxy-6-metoxy-1,4-benzoquinol methylase [Alcanivorax hongdengensis A-11-3]|uniref:2-polyprenyl-3-methyl-5-hydroxy-6-metoxy-1, 4-benzoquinol methylase n=1 Tax=Alcanivorax hongdengensis A-11-3 TaxID=1177179 RepID=L0W9P1_9GAMM|nr:class I SAM-dependent methyltransferase [Alcanivorax hongdengensis]EKF73719.1 2-polyprenyl-3-methyl-5-hydroxy-6-metoxy-1,4-benzoquinol methylase [Alcanivorax hongdengensis A-11-3]
MAEPHAVICPLCEDRRASIFRRVDGQDYFRCPTCRLTFQDPATLPPLCEEKAQYDLHENDPEDEGYRRFLDQLGAPLRERLDTGAKGLDFGCGPGPALARLMEEHGHPCAVYDPIYAPDSAVLAQQYDFVTCTEVLEHLHRPGREWQQFARLVKPGGWLGLMTRWLTDDDGFDRWHYRRDPTHVCFWQPDTFRWLSSQQGWNLILIGNPVVLMQRSGH